MQIQNTGPRPISCGPVEQAERRASSALTEPDARTRAPTEEMPAGSTRMISSAMTSRAIVP